MSRSTLPCLLALLCLAVGCSPHSMWHVTSQQDVEFIEGEEARQPHANRVFVTRSELPPAAYVRVAILDVTKVWYGSLEKALDELADMARDIGADAVIGARAWAQPAGFGWASPQSSGIAVVLTEQGRRDLDSFEGQFR